MTETQQTHERRFLPVEVTLRTITVVFRVVGACWLIVLSLVTLLTSEPRTPIVSWTALIVSAIAVAVVWTPVTVVLAFRKPETLSSVPFVVIDVALACWTALTPNLTQSESFFAGGYPISAAFLVAATRGISSATVVGVLVAATSVLGSSYAPARTAEVLAINIVSPLVVAWGFDSIRRNDERRRIAEAALAAERAERARADERAEVAAHLHDSVLQTLAMVQRRVQDPRAVVRLARRQERELRAWLDGAAPYGPADGLNSALQRAVTDLEDEHDILVELSTVGDTPLDERTTALVSATREAMINAARFSGVERIYVLVETTSDGVAIVVRDRGSGFDPLGVPEDRRGIRESIVGRLARLGGTATVTSAPGQGTEVDLRLWPVS
ncbi:MAG TPA: ATP-binding protein [Acidimicrobiia bacterium]